MKVHRFHLRQQRERIVNGLSCPYITQFDVNRLGKRVVPQDASQPGRSGRGHGCAWGLLVKLALVAKFDTAVMVLNCLDDRPLSPELVEELADSPQGDADQQASKQIMAETERQPAALASGWSRGERQIVLLLVILLLILIIIGWRRWSVRVADQ